MTLSEPQCKQGHKWRRDDASTTKLEKVKPSTIERSKIHTCRAVFSCNWCHGMCALIKLEGSSVDRRVWMSEVRITDIPEPLLNISNNVQVFYPWLRVQVSKFTETKSFLPSSTTTPGPITTFGPIRQPLPMVAEESWEDKTMQPDDEHMEHDHYLVT